MREAPSEQAFLAALEREGLASYSRDGKLQGVELDGKKYRFKRTIGIDVEQHEWMPSKTQEKEVDASKELITSEGLQVESPPIPEAEVTPMDVVEAPPKNEPVQNSHESIPAKEADAPKAPVDDLPQSNPIEGPVNPQHIQRSSELSSIRIQRKIGRDRDEKDENDGFRR
jgi:hypothetical protein